MLRKVYGAGPLHLLAMLLAYGMAAWAVAALWQGPAAWQVVLWIALAVVVHDLVFLPLYTGLYRLAWRVGRVGHDKRRRVAVLHHLVVPVALSVFALIAALPLVLRLSEPNYRPTTGMTTDPFLWRWLALTAGLLLASALVYALRAARLGRRPEAEGGERAGDEPAEGADVR